MKSLGFSLIELVLAVALFLIVAGSALPISSNWFSLNNFDSTFSMTLSSLRKAQSFAIDNKSDTTWGVCLTGSTLRFFSGSCLSPVIKNDYAIPNNVNISGLSTVTFSKFRGEPSSTQSIVLSTSGKTKTITLNILGGIDIN